ncbi:hypothetical protein TRIUR3_17408 [Triticum urartu]|uniref:Uncharacterized protein n=1 Tax=Triticum urartu TaxID=4572 RepID=M7YYC6_TRIUA|nr:hypothetical protein TRIUR3_17408 [Triticum urartu]
MTVDRKDAEAAATPFEIPALQPGRDLGIRVSGYGCIGNWELLSSSNLVMSPLIGGELGSSTSFGLDAAASDV